MGAVVVIGVPSAGVSVATITVVCGQRTEGAAYCKASALPVANRLVIIADPGRWGLVLKSWCQRSSALGRFFMFQCVSSPQDAELLPNSSCKHGVYKARFLLRN